MLDAYVGGRRQLHRHRRRLLRPNTGALRDDHRRLDGRPRQPRRGSCIATKVGVRRARLSAREHRRARRRARWRGCGPTASTSTTPTSTTRTTPLEETRARVRRAGRAGKVRYIAASNYSAERLTESLELPRARAWRRYVALQPHYNLVERDLRGRVRADRAPRTGSPCVPYFALATGFLTGKYRPGGDGRRQPARRGRRAYLDERGAAVLAALDEVAAAHGVDGRRGRAGLAARAARRRRADRERPHGRAAGRAAARRPLT